MQRHFDDWIKSYCATLTPKGEAPDRFHHWCGVSAIAAVLRRRVYIDMGTFRWFPNFFCILVAPPGLLKKSTTIDVGLSMVRRIDGIHIGSDCTTWQQLVTEVAAAEDIFAEPGDTATNIVDQSQTMTCAITFGISELGTFFDPDDHLMVNILTELYDCKVDAAFRKATKTQGEDVIMNPFVNLIAGTTPEWMRQNFRGRFGGWGLSSRLIFTHCDDPEQFITFPDELWGNDLHTWHIPFFEDLQRIAQLRGPMILPEETRALARPWYQDHGARIRDLSRHPNHDPWLAYYLARKFVHIMKLSIVFSVSRRDTLVILPEDFADATRRCNEIELELSKVFVSREANNRDSKLFDDVWKGISHVVRTQGYMTVRDFYAYTIRWTDYGKAKALLDHLLKSTLLALEQSPEGGGKLVFGERGRELEARLVAVNAQRQQEADNG